MKRLLSVLLCLSMLSGLLTACHTGDEPVEPDASATAGTDAPVTTVTEAVTTPETEPEDNPYPYDNTHAYIFANSDKVSNWIGQGAEISYEFGLLKMIPTTGDPILSCSFTPEEQVDADEYPYVAYRYKITSTLTQGVFFVSSTSHPQFNDAGLTWVNLNNRGEWVNHIDDMRGNAYWEDTITAFRIDPINGAMDANAVIYLDRVGFFKTRADAKAFLEDAKEPDFSTAATISQGFVKAFAPSGTLYEGYDPADYLPARTDSAAAAQNGISPMLAIKKGDTLTPVPVSYINSVGFMTYMAQEKGEYVLFYPDNIPEGDGGFVTARGILTEAELNASAVTREQVWTALQNTLTDKGSSPAADWAKSIGIDTADGAKAASAADIAGAAAAYLHHLGAEIYTDPDYYPSADSSEAVKLTVGSGIITDIGASSLTGEEFASLLTRMIKAILGQPVLPSNISDKETIRIAGWSNFTWKVDDAAMKMFADAGLNLMVSVGDIEQDATLRTVLNGGNKYGIEILRHNYSPWTFSAANPQALPTSCFAYFDYDSYLGNYIFDEPGSDHYDMMAQVTDYYNKMMPGKLCYYNLLPMYANAAQLKFGAGAADIDYYDSDPDLYKKYVEAYAEKIPGDYICVDIYPNRTNGKSKATYGDYLRNMDIFATACRKYDRDFWLYVQTTGLDGIREPDYVDMRWQMYIGLAFGVNTFLHFTYGSYPGNGWTDSMVTNGQPTDVYYAAQKVNREIMALSDDYVQYRSLGAFNKNCTPYGYAQFDNQYKDFDILTGIKSGDPLLFGCYEKEEGEGYAFTVVNMYDLKKEKKAKVSFTLEGNHTVSAWIRGEKTVLTPVDGAYSLDLEAAEGVFVMID